MSTNTFNKIKTNMNCQFCGLEIKNVYNFILSTAPDDPQGFMHYEYFQKEIYTCNKHKLSCNEFTLNGEELD